MQLSHVSMKEANRLAYKDMSNLKYGIATLSLYAVIIVGAILIQDISTIFDFAAAISISALAFVFPGWFYLKAESKFGKPDTQYRCLAWTFLAIGGINFILGMSANVISIAQS